MTESYGTFPRIVLDPKAVEPRTTLFGIRISPKIDLFGGVIAQERFKFLHRWKSIAIALVLAFLAYMVLKTLLLIIAAVLVYSVLQHGVERKADAIFTSAASQMYGIPVEQIAKQPIELLREANSWVYKRFPQLARDVRTAKELF